MVDAHLCVRSSCWAFGGVESISDRFCIESKGQFNEELSFQQMTSCAPADGCNGGEAIIVRGVTIC